MGLFFALAGLASLLIFIVAVIAATRSRTASGDALADPRPSNRAAPGGKRDHEYQDPYWLRLRRIDLGDGPLQEVTGESYHIGRIRQLWEATEGGGRRFKVLLAPEPTNRFDKHAILVVAEEVGPVGYVPRDERAEYRDLRAYLLTNEAVGVCEGKLVGEWGDDDGTTIPPGIMISVEPASFTPTPTPKPPLNLPPDWASRPRVPVGAGKTQRVAIVGEAAPEFQEILARVDAGRVAEGATSAFEAVLVPLSDGAVAVCADGSGPIGRLSKSTLARYAAVFDDLRAGGSVGVCAGLIVAEREALGAKVELEQKPGAPVRA